MYSIYIFIILILLQTGSYLNPPQAPFPPPPLDSNSGFMTYNDDSETHLKNRLESGESYESDSGISMGHSPQSKILNAHRLCEVC